ncbi:hypothetical protein I7I48_10495 [Histoplasma ohiense]|nr:hypothetical protein I7I48_10495 [Histoplasma ohiense (nom. inval.)]
MSANPSHTASSASSADSEDSVTYIIHQFICIQFSAISAAYQLIYTHSSTVISAVHQCMNIRI